MLGPCTVVPSSIQINELNVESKDGALPSYNFNSSELDMGKLLGLSM